MRARNESCRTDSESLYEQLWRIEMKMETTSVCFGRWIANSANKCDQCNIQLACYSKMKENEKTQQKQQKLDALKEIPWYKRNNGDQDTPTYGVCEKCG